MKKAGGISMSDLKCRTPEEVQSEIKRTRHKAELPLYAGTIIVGFITILVWWVIIFRDSGALDQLKDILAKENITDASPEFNQILLFCIGFISLIGGIGCLLYYMFCFFYAYYKQYADEMSYAIRVSEKNFPELYEYVKEFTRLLGMKKEPEVYIQSTGSINAFACWVPGKTFIRINAEVVDLAYMEHKDMKTVAFIMAHEFGHLYFHHVHMLYCLWTNFVTFIPVVGKTLIHSLYIRSQEYSADRVAQALMGESKEDGMMLLTAGRHLYKYADINDYLEMINKNHNFFEKLARFITNLFTDHPINPFRIAAIMDENKKSGRLI